MVVSRRVRTILCGAVANCLTAIILVSLFLTVSSVVSLHDLAEVAVFPVLLLYVAIIAGPFSLFTGLIGMVLLTRSRRRQPEIGQYLAEAIAIGALLGASFPVIAAAARLNGLATWGNLVLGIVCGGTCGMVIGYLSRRRVLETVYAMNREI